MPFTVVMVTTSYPRFPGDTVGTFMEPIAHGVAGRGHTVHVVAPWHPDVRRPPQEGGVHFHFFRYAPHPALNVFGYAQALRADVHLRGAAWMAAPLAVIAGWAAARRVAGQVGADLLHGHWIIPGGAIAAAAAGPRPVVISLHGSGVYVAERYLPAAWAARYAFGRADWVTACSEDLRQRGIALGAAADRTEVVPYGVDADRFRPDTSVRDALRRSLDLETSALVVFAAGRLVRKKGFEYLVDAMGTLRGGHPGAHLVIAGSGDLEVELRERAAAAGAADRVHLLGAVPHEAVASWLAAADVAVVPSVRDASGNVDGLPNVVLESLASATPTVTTRAGGIGAVVADGETAAVVAERDAAGLARAIGALLADPGKRRRLGTAARQIVLARHGWGAMAERFERAYERAAAHRRKLPSNA